MDSIITFKSFTTYPLEMKNFLMINTVSAFTLLLALSLMTVEVKSQVSNPSGDLENSDPSLIWAQTLTGNTFNEFWKYHFQFDSGMKLYVTFSAAGFGNLKSPVTGARVSVHYPDGTIYQLSREYPIEHLVQDRDSGLFELRPDRGFWFKGHFPESQQLVINTTKDGVSYDIDLTLSGIQRGLRLGDGKYGIGGDKIGIVTHIPFAKAEGRVNVSDRENQVRGTAFMDHTYQNRATTQLMNSGYRFIHHENAENWSSLYFMLPKETRNRNTIGHYLWSRDGEIGGSAVIRITELHSGKAFGNNLPRIIILSLENGESIRLRRTEDREKFSILGELSWIARRAARTFLGGEVIDYRGEAMLYEKNRAPIVGDYDFFQVD